MVVAVVVVWAARWCVRGEDAGLSLSDTARRELV
jgi:hypothetical protein